MIHLSIHPACSPPALVPPSTHLWQHIPPIQRDVLVSPPHAAHGRRAEQAQPLPDDCPQVRQAAQVAPGKGAGRGGSWLLQQACLGQLLRGWVGWEGGRRGGGQEAGRGSMQSHGSARGAGERITCTSMTNQSCDYTQQLHATVDACVVQTPLPHTPSTHHHHHHHPHHPPAPGALAPLGVWPAYQRCRSGHCWWSQSQPGLPEPARCTAVLG
jgi:hypothetical protein